MPAATKPKRLLGEERRRKILEILGREGRVTVDGLVKRFGVGPVTARSDLDALANSGALVRAHGGALPTRGPQPLSSEPASDMVHGEEKARIGEGAAGLVKPGQTVLLDSGTTTQEIARCIAAGGIRPLTVITNSLNIAAELVAQPEISLVMLGGLMRPPGYFIGPDAEQALSRLNADQAFLGVTGFDVAVGPSTPDLLEAQLKTAMMRVAREVTVVADSSKFGRRSLSIVGRIEQIDRIITDTGLAPDIVAALHQREIEVLLV